ncbi:cation:proton antiporter [Alkalihalobacillus alcalophilus ATCC 27647 = CGMCC 1.3604]|uniref:Cation:proton antiporter n=1 Tax=Alkalihalobacillus alcalophilus ATCC 27647 = CGMCC 1.3604 TaxID=1218173 RepID=J8TNX1_ALKAL|nr:Na(+)/H(+) antiporter subunit F1 [Alkalihalobacillus alcalophilus]AFV25874.1 multicomponent sodium ion:proton antiporter transporter [Alkalihalobacillus alcalophilus ATCC 27647 = CGMCC 1.3604]KGA97130.1 cation:proton antiporter [Alkalihalobacillus alcalophilus ATCC 27647 = CGMCC 1.3604]MED1560598.1 Na(+)/H(+) antiporter subunit F1 [Alkalihalobacillus alcalophilus]THG89074.1 cation:proton antiporter [Alkalihalobacillus alcalophilus ATCC 27647 = CGMCC 1.3604]
MFETILFGVLIMMSLSLFICLIRTVIGPTTSDRIIALDTFGITLIGFIGVIMILQDTLAYTEVILVISILAFIGTVAMSKFIERGVIIDRG